MQGLKPRIGFWASALVPAALLLAACGGSSSSGTTTTSSLTKAELIKRGDEICSRGDKAIEVEAEEFAQAHGIDVNRPTTAQQEEVVRKVVAPAVRSQAESIAKLGAPRGAEEEVEAIVEAVEAGAREAEEDPTLVVESSLGHGAFEEASELAGNFGFKVCGREA